MRMRTDKIGSAHASVWLHALGEELPPETIILPNTAKSAVQRTPAVPRRSAVEPQHVFDAYPNPTSGTQWMVYTWPLGAEKVSLLVNDAVGRTVFSGTLSDPNGLVELNTSAWSAGVYNATIIADDLTVGSLKLIVQR